MKMGVLTIYIRGYISFYTPGSKRPTWRKHEKHSDRRFIHHRLSHHHDWTLLILQRRCSEISSVEAAYPLSG